MFYTAYVLCSWRSEGQTIEAEALTAKLKAQIKILAYPGLA